MERNPVWLVQGRLLAVVGFVGAVVGAGCVELPPADRASALISCGGGIGSVIPGTAVPIDIYIHTAENESSGSMFVVRRAEAGDAASDQVRTSRTEGGLAVQLGGGESATSCAVYPTGRFRLNLGPRHPHEIRVAGRQSVRVRIIRNEETVAEGRFDPDRDEELTLRW